MKTKKRAKSLYKAVLSKRLKPKMDFNVDTSYFLQKFIYFLNEYIKYKFKGGDTPRYKFLF